MVTGAVTLAEACGVGPGARPEPPFPPPRAGNTLGEEGCEQLQEVLDGFSMATVLASLRWELPVRGWLFLLLFILKTWVEASLWVRRCARH